MSRTHINEIRERRALARISKIVEEIDALPRGPLLTASELAGKRTAEVLARIFGTQQPGGDEARPRWATTQHSPPPWRQETTDGDRGAEG